MFKIYSTDLLNKYKMGHPEANFTPVLYIGRKVPKGKNLPKIPVIGRQI